MKFIELILSISMFLVFASCGNKISNSYYNELLSKIIPISDKNLSQLSQNYQKIVFTIADPSCGSCTVKLQKVDSIFGQIRSNYTLCYHIFVLENIELARYYQNKLQIQFPIYFIPRNEIDGNINKIVGIENEKLFILLELNEFKEIKI